MSTTTMLTLLLAVAVIIYMIVRQFTERTIPSRLMLILPLLIAYYTYTNMLEELRGPLLPLVIFVLLLAVGLLLGGGIGLLRARWAHMRIDVQTGTVFAKASALNIGIWCCTLILKIVTGEMLYLRLDHASVVYAVIVAIGTTLFLGNLVAEACGLYLRALRLKSVPEQTVSYQRVKF